MKKVGYHYCSVETFIQIIRLKKVWLSHIRLMNDSKEYLYTFEILESVLSEINDDKLFNSRIIEELKNDFKNEVAFPYVFCMSKQKDLLSQWRAYGDDGRGVAIGFDLSKIPHYDILGNGDKNANIVIEDVTYNKKTVAEILKKMVITIPLLKDKGLSEEVIKYNLSAFYKLLSSFVKNKAFSEEKELRIAYFPCYNYLLKNLTKIDSNCENHLDIQFRIKNLDITSYFELEFVEDSICEIILGPKSKINQNQLTLFLSKYLPEIRINNNISKSNISYT